MARRIIIDKVADLQGVFDGIVKEFNGMDHSGVLSDGDRMLREQHETYFLTNTGPSGKVWPDIDPETARRKGNTQILRDSGALESSLIGQTDDSVRELFSEGDKQGLIWGTRDPNSIRHQRPITAPFDEREHVGTNEEFVDQFADVVADHIVETLKGS